VTARRIGTAAVVVCLLVLPAVVRNSHERGILDQVLIMATLAMSYNLVLGTAGQISMSINAFYATGAYVTVILLTRLGLPQWPSILLSLVACVVAALIVGIPTLRLRGFYLAMATLALAIVTGVVLLQWRPVTGGPDGIGNYPPFELFGWVLSRDAFSYVIVACAIGTYWLLENLLHSPIGRGIRAARDHEGAAVALGIPVTTMRLLALVVGAVLAGVAGNMYAFEARYINPATFSLDLTFLLLFMVVIGGLNSNFGVAMGAGVVVLLPIVLSGLGTETYTLIYGLVTILIIIYAPQGLVGVPARLLRRSEPSAPERASRSGPRNLSDVVLGGAAESNGSDILLRVEGLTRRFGGITAVSNVSFTVSRGTITAVIGPNGAGKTTLFHLLSGHYRCDAGRVWLAGQLLTGLAPHRVAARGLIRTYQTVSLFPEMTVYENLLTGYHRRHGAGLWSSAIRLPRFLREEQKARQVADSLLDAFDLRRWRDTPAGSLPFGLQRSAETARAMAAGPRLLLLDEPAAGLNAQEVEALKVALQQLRDRGITILLIEHNLPMVTDISDWIVVMNFGEVLAQGSAAEIKQNEQVIEAYVGRGRRREPHAAGA
jgi:branched-chain amino acid transport system permease protein